MKYKQFNPYVALCATVVLLGAVITSRAVTTQNFDGGGTAYSAVNHSGPSSPGVLAGGPAGNFYRLMLRTNDCNGGVNSLTFNRTDAGEFTRVVAEFDFRFSNPTPTNWPFGDGFGFVLLSTSISGTNGAPTLPGFDNEFDNPNISGALGIGFDTYEGNQVFVHWDGQQIAGVAATNVLGAPFFTNSVFHRARIEADFLARTVTVTIREDVFGSNVLHTIFNSLPVPNLDAYESRALFGGRNGCAQEHVDLDNISVTWTQSPPTVAVATIQNFDDPGTPYAVTNYEAVVAPGVLAGGPSSNYFRLTSNQINSNSASQNILAFSRTLTGLCTRVVANFDFKLSESAGIGTGDGFSLMLLPTNPFGSNGEPLPQLKAFIFDPPWFAQEEPNVRGALTLGFDTFDGSDGDPAGRHVSLHWNGALLKAVIPDFDIFNSQWNRVHVEADFIRQTLTLLITENVFATNVTNHVVFDDECVPGLAPYEGRVVFGGRTGGARQNCDLDNIRVEYLNAASLARKETSHDFSGGTSYTDLNYGGTNAPGVLGPIELPDYFFSFGSTNGHTGVGTNAIAFRRTHLGAAGSVRFGFNFRIANSDTNDPTRGLCFALLPTSAVGINGDPFPGGLPIDELPVPIFSGAFAIGIRPRLNEDSDPDTISLHWDGSELTSLEEDRDLANGRFHRIEGSLDLVNQKATVKLITDYYGSLPSETLVADNVGVNGIAPYESRLFIGAVTGDSTDFCDIDNPCVQFTHRAPPALSAARDTGLIRLSWPVFDNGFMVQRNFNLSSNNWTTLTNVPAVTNNDYLLLIGTTNPAAFFRLQRP